MATPCFPTVLQDDKISAPDSFLMKKPAFERLPDEIIQQILHLTTPNSFASLIVLNTRWRTVSQQAHLYIHHLSRCPSYSAAHHSTPLCEVEDSLPELRRLFAQEIKRNLFEAYLRPRETIISLVSTSISSSSAPGGEAFHFSLSPKGHYVLAYSSSRIHVIDVTGKEVTIKRELKILRRPASTTITDDGSLLAVLSNDLQIDLYDLTGVHPKHTRAVALDHTPRTIALSPSGSVLAAAYDSGVEVSSLDPSYTNTDRRSVKCYAVDSISFSRDGTQLLGSTLQSRNPSTVVLTAPYYNPGSTLPEESVSALWTTSILFPNGSRDCSHAVLLPSPSDGEASWAFTYDRVFETFRAVRIDDLRNGTTYFTGPLPKSAATSKLLPSTIPAASEAGDLVASGFQGALWLYGVPEDLEALPITNDATNSSAETEVSTPTSQLGRRNSAPSLYSFNRRRESFPRIPQWQLLCDKYRNTFVEGRKVASLDRVSAMTWVSGMSDSFHKERLVSVAPGVLGQQTISEDDGMSPVDGGRISILDFDYSINDGTTTMITIEVGMNEPETLEEEQRDLDTEVAIVRRRTVAQRQGNRNNVARATTTVARSVRPEIPSMPTLQNLQEINDPYAPSSQPTRRPSQQTTSTERSEASFDDYQDAFDAPYSHTSPRSGTTLRRAATAAAVNRRLHPRAVAHEHIEYRRADGREEHPHESDADNWVPPPPPYSREPVPALPEHIQRSLLAEAAAANLQRSRTQRLPSVDFPGLESGNLTRSRTVASSSTGSSRRERIAFHRTLSDSTTQTLDRVSFEDESPRPTTSPILPYEDDIYDVSPPGTPQPSPRSTLPTQLPRTPTNQIPRRPVGSSSHPRMNPLHTPTLEMQATLLQPVSPFQSLMQSTNESSDQRAEDVEESVPHVTERPTPSPDFAIDLATNVGMQICTGTFDDHSYLAENIATGNVDKEVPPRPNDHHHLTELPPSTPVRSNYQELIESGRSLPRRSETAPAPTSPPEELEDGPVPIWRRTGTAPASIQPPSNQQSSRMVMPSADQLARLNSRKGRPQGLTDPRRVSGSASQQRTPSGGSSHMSAPSWNLMQHSPQRLTPDQAFYNRPTQAAEAAVGSYSGSSHGRNSPSAHPVPPQNFYSSSSSSRHVTTSPSQSQSYQRQATAQPPSLRPTMPRLETIHSVTSQTLSLCQTEPSAFLAQKSMMGRQPSRAERSAAKNIKDAKKRGWRASMRKDENAKKKKKDKWGDGASSAGWTDVSMSTAIYSDTGKKSKEGKCVVM